MEDRHTVSEPRPIEDGSHLPSWEVDILRDGTVVDTFLLNNDVLPPRSNKRGKVLWRLPDSLNKLVSYIVDKDISAILHVAIARFIFDSFIAKNILFIL